MGNVLSDRTSERMLNAINFVEGMAAPVQARSNRRVRTRGNGGAERPFIIITTATNVNDYIANVITPTSATVLISAVTVKAKQPDSGQKVPVGKEMFADLVDGIYYIEPPVAFGS
jgi:hypothetical protein